GNVAKGSVSGIPEQKIAAQVVADEQIDMAVAVEISRNDPLAAASRLAQTGVDRRVSKASVALVVKEDMCNRFDRSGVAEDANTACAIAAVSVRFQTPDSVMADIQIEQPVVVVIEKGGTRPPMVGGQTGGRTDLLKRPFTAVAIEAMRSKTIDQEVRKTVGVEIARSRPGTVIMGAQARRCRNVLKSPLPQIAVAAIDRARAVGINGERHSGEKIEI